MSVCRYLVCRYSVTADVMDNARVPLLGYGQSTPIGLNANRPGRLLLGPIGSDQSAVKTNRPSRPIGRQDQSAGTIVTRTNRPSRPIGSDQSAGTIVTRDSALTMFRCWPKTHIFAKKPTCLGVNGWQSSEKNHCQRK